MNRTAIIINSYNMPERTDALVEHIIGKVKLPYDLIVVDNGSDIVEPSKYTTFQIPENIQTTGGFLAGLEYADSLGHDYFAYWLIITSARFHKGNKRDPLKELMDVLEGDELAYAVQPSIVFDCDQAWSGMMFPFRS